MYSRAIFGILLFQLSALGLAAEKPFELFSLLAKEELILDDASDVCSNMLTIFSTKVSGKDTYEIYTPNTIIRLHDETSLVALPQRNPEAWPPIETPRLAQLQEVRFDPNKNPYFVLKDLYTPVEPEKSGGLRYAARASDVIDALPSPEAATIHKSQKASRRMVLRMAFMKKIENGYVTPEYEFEKSSVRATPPQAIEALYRTENEWNAWPQTLNTPFKHSLFHQDSEYFWAIASDGEMRLIPKSIPGASLAALAFNGTPVNKILAGGEVRLSYVEVRGETVLHRVHLNFKNFPGQVDQRIRNATLYSFYQILFDRLMSQALNQATLRYGAPGVEIE